MITRAGGSSSTHAATGRGPSPLLVLEPLELRRIATAAHANPAGSPASLAGRVRSTRPRSGARRRLRYSRAAVLREPALPARPLAPLGLVALDRLISTVTWPVACAL